jgi:hypothetical protein
MATRKSTEPSSAIDDGWQPPDIIEDVILRGEVSAGKIKVVKADSARYVVCLLDALMQRNNLEAAREFAAQLIRDEGFASPEFLTRVADLLSPPTAKKAGRPRSRLRKFELEIRAAYGAFCRTLTPAEARKRVMDEFTPAVSARTVNQCITEYTRLVRDLAARLDIDERQLAPMGANVIISKYPGK